LLSLCKSTASCRLFLKLIPLGGLRIQTTCFPPLYHIIFLLLMFFFSNLFSVQRDVRVRTDSEDGLVHPTSHSVVFLSRSQRGAWGHIQVQNRQPAQIWQLVQLW
jgi:hypothetical protein